jgi:DNA (cytosine-5)-methyltransferase 1
LDTETKLKTALDLFAGSGGFTCGAQWAGLRILQAVEVNAHAVRTYARNNPDVDLINSDVRLLDPLDCIRRLGLMPGDIDVILAGPPCQGFSDSNRRTRTIDNPKNHLYKEVLRFCSAIRPKCVVIENVAGLRTLSGGVVLQSILNGCRELGYEVAWKVLCAADYGVPQLRNRIFIVASKNSGTISFPDPTHGSDRNLRHVTVGEAIRDLPVLRNGAAVDYRPYRQQAELTDFQLLLRDGRVTNGPVQGNLVTRSAELILKRYAGIRAGQNWEALPRRLLRNYQDASRCHTGIYYRLRWDRPAKVLGNFRKNMLIHPSQNRGLSVREAARLQSFPDSYEFVGSIGFQQQQVADAVPPLLAMAVVRHIMLAHSSKEQQESILQLQG